MNSTTRKAFLAALADLEERVRDHQRMITVYLDNDSDVEWKHVEAAAQAVRDARSKVTILAGVNR